MITFQKKKLHLCSAHRWHYEPQLLFIGQHWPINNSYKFLYELWRCLPIYDCVISQLFMFCKGCIPLRDRRYEGYVKGNVSVCLLCLSVYMCTPFDVCVRVSVCAHTYTPTLTLRLWLVQASATSVHHRRYGLWLDSRSGGAQDILSTLSCLLIMISCDGYPTSYRRHGAHMHRL